MRFRKRKKKNDSSDETRLKGQSISTISVVDMRGARLVDVTTVASISPRDFDIDAQMSTVMAPPPPFNDEDDVSSVIHDLTARRLAGEFEPRYVGFGKNDADADLKEDSIIDMEEEMIEAEMEINKHKETKQGVRKLTLD